MKVNENTLKLAAAAAMFVDHLGAAAFPGQVIFRGIGRLAFPVFCYYIFVGCARTRDIYRYLARVFFLGIFCMVVFWLFSGEIYGNTLITFSISIYIISIMQEIRKNVSETRIQFLAGVMVCLVFVLPMMALTRLVMIDYGIWGIYMPVLAELCRVGEGKEQKGKAGFAAGLAGLCISYGGIQYFSLLALPLLLFSGEKKERLRLPRFFFYYYYPLHFAVVYLTAAALA